VGSESVYSWSDPLKRPEYGLAFMRELPFVKEPVFQVCKSCLQLPMLP